MRKTGINAIGEGVEEVHLIGREVFGLLYEERFASIKKPVDGIMEVGLGGGIIRMKPHKPCKLLHIRRVAVGDTAY